VNAASRLLDREQCALVVVDFQEKLVPAIFEKQRALDNSLLLMRAARALDMPIVLTTQYRKGLGSTLPAVLEAAPGVEPIDKLSFGCFGDAAFLERLAQLGRSQLLVCGIESHICVTQTVLGALDAGRLVHVAGDAVSSRSEANWKLGLDRMARAGAVLTSAEMAVYELLRRSDGAAFKAILPLLKG
jgi:nicotinamidase-related amidase